MAAGAWLFATPTTATTNAARPSSTKNSSWQEAPEAAGHHAPATPSRPSSQGAVACRTPGSATPPTIVFPACGPRAGPWGTLECWSWSPAPERIWSPAPERRRMAQRFARRSSLPTRHVGSHRPGSRQSGWNNAGSAHCSRSGSRSATRDGHRRSSSAGSITSKEKGLPPFPRDAQHAHSAGIRLPDPLPAGGYRQPSGEPAVRAPVAWPWAQAMGAQECAAPPRSRRDSKEGPGGEQGRPRSRGGGKEDPFQKQGMLARSCTSLQAHNSATSGAKRCGPLDRQDGGPPCRAADKTPSPRRLERLGAAREARGLQLDACLGDAGAASAGLTRPKAAATAHRVDHQRREWTRQVLDNVKDNRPSTPKGRKLSAGYRRQAARRGDDGGDEDARPAVAGGKPAQMEQTASSDSGGSEYYEDDTHPEDSEPPQLPRVLIRSPSSPLVSKLCLAIADANSSSFGARRSQRARGSINIHLMEVGQKVNEESLKGVFRTLSDDGEVHADSLGHALELLGATPVQKWIDQTLGSLTEHTTLDITEFVAFVKAYKDLQSKEIATAFREVDVDRSGFIDNSELSALLDRLGLKAMEVVVGEILEEVDIDNNGRIELQEFELLWLLLERREGFCKREYDRLLEAFCRFDINESGTIDLEEVCSILNFLNYSTKTGEVSRLFQEVDTSGSGSLGVSEYMLLMRKVRETEINALATSLPCVRVANKRMGLIRMLLALGYLPNEPCMVESARACGIDLEDDWVQNVSPRLTPLTPLSPQTPGSTSVSVPNSRSRKQRKSVTVTTLEVPSKVPLAEAWRFLERYRGSECMCEEERADNQAAWELQPGKNDTDPLGQREVTTSDAQRALMWLGWEAPHQVQQQLLCDVDVDRSGGINAQEFQKLVRMYHEREDQEIARVCGRFALPVDDCLHPVPVESAQLVLEALGVKDVKPGELPPAEVTQGSPRRSPQAQETTDILGIAKVVRSRRSSSRLTYRDNEGFGPPDVQFMKLEWAGAARSTDAVVFEKTMDSMFMLRLLKRLEELLPEHMFQEMEFAETAKDIGTNKRNDTFTFADFVKMMRAGNNARLRKKVEKERLTIESTGFTNAEVRDFRSIFISCAQDGTDRLLLDDLKRLLERVTPLSAKLQTELKLMWKNCVKPYQQEMTVCDFPSFLVLMSEIVNKKFASINSWCPPAANRRQSKGLLEMLSAQNALKEATLLS